MSDDYELDLEQDEDNYVILVQQDEYVISTTQEDALDGGISQELVLSTVEQLNEPIVVIASEGYQGVPGPPGPIGPQGPPGPGGGGGGTNAEYLQTFAIPTQLWTINHNIGTKSVVVETFDHTGDLVQAEVDYIDDNTITVSWYYPTAGSVRVFN